MPRRKFVVFTQNHDQVGNRGGESFSGIEKIDPEIIASYDLIFIAAAHSNVDYDMIQRNAKAIFDSKNAMAAVKDRDNIEVL